MGLVTVQSDQYLEIEVQTNSIQAKGKGKKNNTYNRLLQCSKKPLEEKLSSAKQMYLIFCFDASA